MMHLLLQKTLVLSILAFGFIGCGGDEKEKTELSSEDTDAEDTNNVDDSDDTDDTEEPDPNDVDNDGDGQTENDGDCNDEDGTIYTGADDVTVDGIDQNCDEFDGMDADGDGYADINGGGDDCDDSNPAAYPGAADDDADGVDQNCDGTDGPECVDDDSFAATWPAYDFWGTPMAPVTGCDDVFNEDYGWLGCNSPLVMISYEFANKTLADFCECQCQSLGQEEPYCVTLTMKDSGGDGWNGGYLEIDMLTYTMESGSETSYEICYFEIEGCTSVHYTSGQKSSENTWTITFEEHVIASKGAESATVGEGCSTNLGTCDTCQSMSPNRFFCGEGNYGGLFNGCANANDGVEDCYDGRDEVEGARFTCLPYNYIPPE